MTSTNQSGPMEREVQTTFKNSPDTLVALERLAGAVPKKLTRTIVASVLKIYATSLDKALDIMGLTMNNPNA